MESRRLLNEISANIEKFGRPTVWGKFLFDGDAKLYVRGVTYGTFEPGPGGTGYPVPSVVDADFQQMAANGINAVRTYTVPPRWLLDVALRRGLRVMVGLPWEQHVAFLEERARAGGSSGVSGREFVPARGTQRSCVTRSATRYRRRSCAGTARAVWSGSSGGCMRRQRTRMPGASSRT